MLFHFRYAHLPHVFYWPARYGWMGVDLFFVLSGYLIGSQLLRPYLHGSVPSLSGFYIRRSFRILPAFLAVLALYFAVPVFREAPGLSPAWQFLTFMENFRINYFTDQAFSHVWSLCVEEHFYLCLPLLVLILMRKPRFGKAVSFVLAILLFGIAIRAWVYVHQLKPILLSGDEDSFITLYVEKIYYPTYTRLDGLLVGVVLASIRSFRPLWWQRMLSRGPLLFVFGILCCAWAMWLFRDRFSLSGTLFGFPLISLGLGLVIVASISPRNLEFCRRALLRSAGMKIQQVFIQTSAIAATLAYSLYLTHKEIGHLDRVYLNRYMQSGGWPGIIVLFITSTLAAALLYFGVERPFLRLRERLFVRRAAPSAESAAAR